MNDIDFIKDEELKKRLEDSIEYIFALFEQSKGAGQKEIYLEETYRVIILYVVSVIEAVLLYFYKERGEKIEYEKLNHRNSWYGSRIGKSELIRRILDNKKINLPQYPKAYKEMLRAYFKSGTYK